MLKTVILFAGGQERQAIALLYRAVEVMELNSNLMCASSVGIMDCLHFCFLVAYTAGDVHLMQRIQALRDPLSMVLPSTRRLVEEDARRLEQHINKNARASPNTPHSSSATWSGPSRTGTSSSGSGPTPISPSYERQVFPVPPGSNLEDRSRGATSPFSFTPSSLPSYGGETGGYYPSLSCSSDQIPFSIDEFIESLGTGLCSNKNT